MKRIVIAVVFSALLAMTAHASPALKPIPKEKRGWVEYTNSPSSPSQAKLRLLGAKVQRHINGNVELIVALKNVGSVPCKRCWVLLALRDRVGGPWDEHRILVKSDQRPIAQPGSSWKITKRCRDTNYNVVEWRLIFISYAAGPKDP